MERFLDYFVPESYKLALKIDKGAKTIGGRVTIRGEAKAEKIKFHAVGLSVSEVLMNGKKADFEVDGGVLTVLGVPRSVLTLEVEYEGRLNENMEGAYLSTYEYQGRTEVIVATQFESHYAREAFPCIDEPAAKAMFELSLELPEGADDLVLANTPVAKKEGAKTIFEPTPRMSTYLLAWVIGHFNGRSVTNAHGVEITTFAALNQDIASVDFANEIAARSLEFYDDNFGTPYPLPKLDQVALPDFEAGAMENWGLVTYRESMLLAGEAATLETKKSVATTVAHELSHQWFGDLVTMRWWDDLWLNESFASVMEYYAVNAIKPEFRIFENFFTSDVIAALRRDALSGVQSVHQEVANPAEIAVLFDPAIVYAKGARLMLMLIRAMGWEKFCAGIREYFARFQYGNTVGDDLWAALAPHAEFDVPALMHAFIDKPGYPVVESEEDDFSHYSQRRFLLDGPMKKSDWPIPGVREDLSGHYILNLTDEEFQERLARFDQLGVEEKLRLLIDRDLVTKTELAPSASLLDLLWRFREEPSAAVWEVIATIVNGLKIFFAYKTPEEAKFKKFVGELVHEKLDEIGVTGADQDENVVRLRDILTALDFYAESEGTIKALADLYDEDFAKLDPELRDGILAAKIRREPEVYDYYLEQYQAQADPGLKDNLLNAMAGSKDETNARKALTLLEQTEIVKPQDQLYLFVDLYRNPVARGRAFTWLREHWDTVVEMAGDKSISDYPRYLAAMMKTGAELDEYKEFFWPKRDDPALTRAIEMGVKQVEARLELIEADKRGVYEKLK